MLSPPSILSDDWGRVCAKEQFAAFFMSMGSLHHPQVHASMHRGWSLGWCVAMCFCLSLVFTVESEAKKKPNVPRPEPELKIVDLHVTPTPYESGNGPLQFTVTVQLPKELDGATILEVTSLISSPSKTSLRFLSHRRPVEIPAPGNGETERAKVSIELSWDGQNHRKQLAGAGVYTYEVRTKLLANGDKGPRTIMVAWPKRGTVEVK